MCVISPLNIMILKSRCQKCPLILDYYFQSTAPLFSQSDSSVFQKLRASDILTILTEIFYAISDILKTEKPQN